MVSYVIRRLFAMIPALLGIALITFVLMHLTKGGPFTTERSDPAVLAAQMRAYHLDEPLWPTFVGSGDSVFRWALLVGGLLSAGAAFALNRRKKVRESRLQPVLVGLAAILFTWAFLVLTQPPWTSGATGFVPGQFLRYLGSLLQGNLGTSFTFHRPVNDIIGDALPNSFALGLAAFALLVLMAIPLGVVAALRQNSWVDYLASGISLIGYSIPNFVLGVLFILLSLRLAIPIAEWGQPKDLIFPAIVLAIRPLAVLARLTRASMIEVLNQDYIRTAWAKGLRARVVVTRHGLRNALLPVVTVLGDHLGDLITGSIVVEYLFNVPGIGQWFVRSVQARDYGIIMGTTLFYATLVLLINLIVDLLYAVIDPRIKLGASARS